MLGWLRRRRVERPWGPIVGRGMPDGYVPPSGSLKGGPMRPSVGRTVHYVAHGTPIREDGTQAFPSACRAAVITETARISDAYRDLSTVGLCVLNPTGQFFHSLGAGGCAYDEGSEPAEWSCDGLNHAGGTWHWPARVED